MGTTAERSGESGGDWADVCRTTEARDESLRSAQEWDRYADALFWTDRVHESISARRRAYATHREMGDHRSASLAAWRLFYDHFLVGEDTVANGWRERCRRHADEAGDDIVDGWLAIADADTALRAGDSASASALAAGAAEAGTADHDADLFAMALQALGRAEIAAGRRTDGLRRLDEAMVSVINDELEPLFTGWVYCNVVSTCHGLADLRRAAEWSDAAMRWCRTLREGRMYPGLCRVYAAELASLRGDLGSAEEAARRACDELMAFDPRYSGEAHYLVGDLCRIGGRFDEAEAMFMRSHELGRDPQPGLGRLLADRGRTADALAALRSALRPGPAAPLPRVDLLGAVIEVASAADEPELVRSAAGEIIGLAAAGDSAVLDAHAAAARAAVYTVDGDARGTIDELRRSVRMFADVGCTRDAARQRLALGRACVRAGDEETGRIEITAAFEAFDRIAATIEADLAALALRSLRTAGGTATASPLTARETEVLALVADGLTDAEIADRLILSPHTVARHVGNIRTKLGVPSRAAATSRAFELGLLGDGRSRS